MKNLTEILKPISYVFLTIDDDDFPITAENIKFKIFSNAIRSEIVVKNSISELSVSEITIPGSPIVVTHILFMSTKVNDLYGV